MMHEPSLLAVTHSSSVLVLTTIALTGPLWSFMLASMSCDCGFRRHTRTMPVRAHTCVHAHKHSVVSTAAMARQRVCMG
jgi:hypothetical protein